MEDRSAMARAQAAADALDRVAVALKRQHRETRDLIQQVRRAQMHALGIDVNARPEGGRSDHTSTSQDPEAHA